MRTEVGVARLTASVSMVTITVVMVTRPQTSRPWVEEVLNHLVTRTAGRGPGDGHLGSNEGRVIKTAVAFRRQAQAIHILCIGICGPQVSGLFGDCIN